MRRSFLFAALFVSSQAFACPFCDYGGQDTAAFILSFFGFIALAGAFFFALFLYRGGLKDANSTKTSVLRAENIDFDQPNKDEVDK